MAHTFSGLPISSHYAIYASQDFEFLQRPTCLETLGFESNNGHWILDVSYPGIPTHSQGEALTLKATEITSSQITPYRFDVSVLDDLMLLIVNHTGHVGLPTHTA